MIKLLLYFVVCYIIVRVRSGDIGPGVWKVIHIEDCHTESHQYELKFGMKKINRTHDAFFGNLKLGIPIDDSIRIHIDICKNVDGGCKQYLVLSDESAVKFIYKYAEENVKACLGLAGVDPPEFPVKEGEYQFEGFAFNYDELPEECPYGTFIAKVYLLEDTVEQGCVCMHAEFSKKQDDDGDED